MFYRILIICAILGAVALGCDEDRAPVDSAPVQEFELRFLSGWIRANLMPVAPPDPISAKAIIEASNLTSDTLSQVSIPWADVILADPNRTLGRIEFATSWSGLLAAHETDTVAVNKVDAGTKLFDPPCGQKVLFKFMGQLDREDVSVLYSDTLTFECFE